jgi:hypothetical protein
MGKMKDWIIRMEEDASLLTRSEWIKVHGAEHAVVYDHEQSEVDPDWSDFHEGSILNQENWNG